MYRFLMRPSNMVCDVVGITDENERGMMRMFVNMLLLSMIGVFVFVVAIRAF